MQAEKLLTETLRNNGFKVTRPRVIVFTTLHNNPPMTMNELVSRIKGEVDRVSAYRILALYEKLGIIKRIAIGWKYKVELGELFSIHHHHITCKNCGEVTMVREDVDIERIIDKLGKDNGFKVTSHQLELQGYCAKCQEGFFSSESLSLSSQPTQLP